MYLKFFELKEKPFSVTSDPNFLYMSHRHKEAFSHLKYGIQERMGFIEITGEIGTGKTTLCKALLNQLDEKTKTAFILNSNLSEIQLLQAIVEDFGMTLKNRTRLNLISELNRFLLEQLKHRNNVVLIIDEAQNLKAHLLEQIRLLSNLETQKAKLLQIVLVGQPELRAKLNSPQLEQLRQRIGVRYHILPLDRTEVPGYVYHRLNVAGSGGRNFFTEEAFEEIFNFSKGIPRLINIICDKALLAGYVMETRLITEELINRCKREIEGNFEIVMKNSY